MDILFIFIIYFVLGLAAGLLLQFFKVKKINDENLRKYTYDVIKFEEHIERKKKEIKEIDQQILSHLSQLDETIKQEASAVDALVEKEKERAYEAFSAYVNTLEFSYQETEEEFDRKMNLLKEELDKMKAARVANIQAALREKELKEKENFYKIYISEGDLEDIKVLDDVKPKLRHPEILSKLIWTTYYQKNVNALCSNVLGDKNVCGIYKITDTITDMAYIGQSVNIAQRWKDHIKAALGASNTASSNKLYTAMREDGIHNFTFELLEQTPADQLNEKEKYYIDFYQSSIYGLNTAKGVSN